MSLVHHRGSCHCGAVQYRVALDLDAGTTSCNCRYCTKYGHWSAFVRPDAFELLAGEEALGPQDPEAYFDRRRCQTCQVLPFSSGFLEQLGGAFVSINVRTLDDVDLAGVPVRYLDGRNDTWAELATVPYAHPVSARQ